MPGHFFSSSKNEKDNLFLLICKHRFFYISIRVQGERMSSREPSFFRKFQIVLTLLAILWFIEIADLLILGGNLDGFGIRPRSLQGLAGIFIAPFLHGGISHLASNSMPFLVLSLLIISESRADYFAVSLVCTLSSGLGTWLIAPSNTVHVGASGVIFGYFGYLLFKGIFHKKIIPLAISILLLVYYGSMLFGVLPFLTLPGISWQAHLFGFLGGVLCAKLTANKTCTVDY